MHFITGAVLLWQAAIIGSMYWARSRGWLNACAIGWAVWTVLMLGYLPLFILQTCVVIGTWMVLYRENDDEPDDSPPPSARSVEGPFVCSYCGKRFQTYQERDRCHRLHRRGPLP